MAYTSVEADAGSGGALFNVDRVGGVDTPVTKMAHGVEGTITPVTAAAPLPVTVTAVASGDNNIGNVDVASLPALVAGTANIGDVDVLTIAAGDNNIGNVDIVTVPADPYGVNADAASATGSISAKLRGIATALGITAFDLGSGTGGSRTLRIFKDTAQWVGGSGANGTAVQRFTVATDDTVFGALGETAPATDTASSGLNGRLQRIAQRLTSLISPGLSARVSVTRPSDTTTYTANDVVGVTGGGTATITFALGAISASRIMITSVSFERDATALISGETSYLLHLYDVTQPAAQVDNAAFDLASGDRTAYLGSINLGTPVDLGSTLYVSADNINKQVKLAGTSIFGVLVTVGGYQPASAAVHIVTLHAVQL